MSLTINVAYIHSLGLPDRDAGSVHRMDTQRAVLRDVIDSVIQTALTDLDREGWCVEVSGRGGVDLFVLVTELQACFPGTHFDYRMIHEASSLYRIRFST
jgi:hypothetical protein